MVAKLTILTKKLAIQLHVVAENCTLCSSRSRRSVRKVLDTPSYVNFFQQQCVILFHTPFMMSIQTTYWPLAGQLPWSTVHTMCEFFTAKQEAVR